MKNKLRIVLITQGVSRVVVPLLNSGHEIVGILESMPRGFDENKKKSLVIGLLKKIYSAIKGSDYCLRDFCLARKIPYNFIWKKNAVAISSWLNFLRPDLIVVFSMSQLLRNEILKIPPLGVINLHPSILPSYRGANPDFWQYYDMEMHPGVTVHYLDSGEDTGDIIFQDRIYIPLGTKSPARLDKMIGELGVFLLLRAVDAIAQGNAPRKSQPKISPTARARNLLPDEHIRIIDWECWPIERVWHVLRGTELWLNAIAQPGGVWKGQRWSIEEYEKTDVQQGDLGCIGIYKKRKCIFVRDGVIYIRIHFDWKKALIVALGSIRSGGLNVEQD